MSVPASSAGGEALLAEIRRALVTLEALRDHRDALGHAAVREVEATCREVRRRLERPDLHVAVVGEKKAGKSTFLNALLGDDLLGAKVRECTGSITRIRTARTFDYQVTWTTGQVQRFSDVVHDLGPDFELRRQAIATVDLTNAAQVDDEVAFLHDDLDSHHLRCPACNSAMVGGHPCPSCRRRRADVYEGWIDAMRQALASCTSRGAAFKEQVAHLASALGAAQAVEDRLRERDAVRDAGPGIRGFALASDEVRGRLTAARAAVRASTALLEAQARRLPPFIKDRPAWWSLGFWLLRLILILPLRSRICAYERLVDDVSAANLAEATALKETVASAQIGYEAKLAAFGADLEDARDRAQSDVHHRTTEARTELASYIRDVRGCLSGALTLHHLRRRAAFRHDLARLTDMDADGAQVRDLAIDYPAKFLPPGLVLIDTPGVNTDVKANAARAWDAIRSEADGCILLSDITQLMSASTQAFMSELLQVVPHLLLVLTKIDLAAANATIGMGSAAEQLEEAQRQARRLFAEGMGRKRREVLAIAVAAGPALEATLAASGRTTSDLPTTNEDPAEAAFRVEVARILDVLRTERVILLGARAEGALRPCIDGLGAHLAAAEAGYRRRISELEAQRIPEPAAFRAQQLRRIAPEISRLTAVVIEESATGFDDALGKVFEGWVGSITRADSKDELARILGSIEARMPATTEALAAGAARALNEAADKAVRELQVPLLVELKERYQIAQKVVGAASGATAVSGAGALLRTSGPLGISLSGAVTSHTEDQIALGMGGAAFGAMVGTMVFPGLGTIVGAAIGSLLAFFKTLASLKDECSQKLFDGLTKYNDAVLSQLRGTRRAVEAGLTSSLGTIIEAEQQRFAAWIAQVLADEQARIDEERHRLSNLVRLRDAMVEHQARLARLREDATLASAGLCSLLAAGRSPQDRA